MVCSKCGVYTKAVQTGGLCKNCFTVKMQSIVAKTKAMGIDPPKPKFNPFDRKNGDFWQLSASTTPFGTEQWGCQGTARTPYIVTHYLNRKDGSTTTDGWACSCPNFTQHVPRTECKHILKIMLACKVAPTGMSNQAAKANANLTNEDAVAFEKWKREQAEKVAKPSDTAGELELFGKTGRKFR